MAKRKLEVEIVDTHRGTGFRDSEREASSWGKKLAGFAKVAAIGLAGVGIAGVTMGLDMVKAAEESAKVTKQTAAVIKSMGNVAGVSADQVADLSEKLAMKTGVDDELIQSGQNVLLTFANIRNEVGQGNQIFTRATEIALDMSVALGQDMQSSVVQLGKALNDPIKGITALSRVGVTFTEEQKEQIKTLVEHGDVLAAQKVILDELGKEFAGSAEAQATASDKLAVVWGNLQETLGEKLLPLAEAFSTWMIDVGVPWIEQRLAPAIEEDLVPAIESLVAWLADNLLPALEDTAAWIGDYVVPALQDLVEWFDNNEWAIKGVVAALGVALAAFIAVKLAAIGAAIGIGIVWLAAAAPILAIVAVVALVVGAFVLAFELIRRNLNGLGVDFSNVWGAIQRNVSAAWRAILHVAGVVFDAIHGRAAWASGLLKTIAHAIQTAFRMAFQGILIVAQTVFAWIIRAAERVASAVRSTTAGIKAAGGSGGGPLAGVGAVIGRFATGGLVRGRGPKAAIVHGGELIMNAEQQGRLWDWVQGGPSSAGGVGGDTHIHVHAGTLVVARSQSEFDEMVAAATTRALAVNPRAVTVQGRPL